MQDAYLNSSQYFINQFDSIVFVLHLDILEQKKEKYWQNGFNVRKVQILVYVYQKVTENLHMRFCKIRQIWSKKFSFSDFHLCILRDLYLVFGVGSHEYSTVNRSNQQHHTYTRHTGWTSNLPQEIQGYYLQDGKDRVYY